VQYCECVASAGGRVLDVVVDPSGQYTWAVEIGSADRDSIDACEAAFLASALAFARARHAQKPMSSDDDQLAHFRQWVAPVNRTVVNADGSTTTVLTGHNLVILFPSDDPPGPSTTLHTGRVVFKVDTAGTFTILKTTGRALDICATLS
jgi:hypothetical protein